MDVYTVDINAILPTQFYISKRKYRDSLVLFKEKGLEGYEPEMANPLADLAIDLAKIPERKSEICEEILRSLPRWFGIEEAIKAYVAHVRDLPFVSVLRNSQHSGARQIPVCICSRRLRLDKYDSGRSEI